MLHIPKDGGMLAYSTPPVGELLRSCAEEEDIEEEHWSLVVASLLLLELATIAAIGVVDVDDDGVSREKLSALSASEHRVKVRKVEGDLPEDRASDGMLLLRRPPPTSCLP